MGYTHALRTAGAEVLQYKQTGSYQGTWGAVCRYNGQTVLVTGYYGSCSVCDAYQSQFGYLEDDPVQDETTGKWYSDWTREYEISQEQVDAINEEHRQKLVDFGMSYLRNPLTKDMVQSTIDRYNAKGDDDWFDNEERELYDWAIKFLI